MVETCQQFKREELKFICGIRESLEKQLVTLHIISFKLSDGVNIEISARILTPIPDDCGLSSN